jgi:tRNA threonylcarbamoyladenosine biosynthesis protein TsaE
VGKLIKEGIVIELRGDVGAGKTTFASGVGAGLGFNEEMPSPTFTVGRVYPASGGRQIYHFDFYRLNGPDIVTEELAEATADPKATVMIEWAGHGAAKLPSDRLRVSLRYQANEDRRGVEVESLGSAGRYQYIVEGLQHAYRHSD